MEQTELNQLQPEANLDQRGRAARFVSKVFGRFRKQAGVEYDVVGLDIFDDPAVVEHESITEERSELSVALAPVAKAASGLPTRQGRVAEGGQIDSAFSEAGTNLVSPVATESNTPETTSVERTVKDMIAHNAWKEQRMAEVISLDEHRTAKQNFQADPLNAPMPVGPTEEAPTYDQVVQDQYGPFSGKHVVGQ